MNKGFTLLEMLLVIAAISIIVAFSTPLYQQYQVRTELDTATNVYVKSLRSAEFQSESVDGDSAWGVRIQAGSIVLFKGATYATRTTAYDVTYTILSSIAITGTTEFDFNKWYATPVVAGTTTLTSSTGEVRTVTINSKGMITY